MGDWDDIDLQAPRRKFSRRQVALATRLRYGDEEVSAVTENISPGGAFLRVQLPETAREVVAAIDLPHGRDVRVRAMVRWRRAGEPPGVGIEFETFLEQGTDLEKALD